jgi:putative lipoprotein
MAEIAGSIVYRQRVALPRGAQVEVAIMDASRKDAPAAIVGRSEIALHGQQVPLPFHVSYDETAIDLDHRYVMRVQISVNGRLRWVNDSSVPVITNAPTRGVVVVVVPVRG